MANLINYLDTLNKNLEKSFVNFKIANQKIPSQDIHNLYDLLHKLNGNLYKYLEETKKIEQTFLSNDSEISKKFILSFDIDKSLYNKNFKEEFKKDMETNINIHKIKEIIPKTEALQYKELSIIDGVDISPNKIKIPIIKYLKDIPPMFYWYEGDNIYKKGIYTSICQGFYSKVPFPNVISTNDTMYKINSIACKYGSKQICQENKKKISEFHNSETRECFYVHKKEKFNKIGNYYRCAVESFGNHKTLDHDLNIVGNYDIKHILMYSLSDDLLSMIWYQNKFKNGELIITNLDIL